MSKSKQKVTFGKMESVSGLWDDDKTCSIMLDGVEVGEMTNRREDVGGGCTILRTTAYDVDFWTFDDKDFSVQCKASGTFEYDYLTARREAKSKVRAILSSTPAIPPVTR